MGVFIENKYYRWYIALTERAKGRVLGEDVYTEAHHILPKSFGGTNSKKNLVSLTAREHFICHRFLMKMTEGKNKIKMCNAIWIMVHGRQNQYHKINSRLYEILRKYISDSKKGEKNYFYGRGYWTDKKRSTETIEKIRIANTGRRFQHSEKTKQKIGDGNKGKKRTEQQNELNRQRNLGKKLSAETKNKISQSNKGKKISEQNKEKLRIFHCRFLYKIIYPDGSTKIVDNLVGFARENCLQKSHLHSVMCGKRKHHKGFKVIKLGEKNNV